jgi:hypothetical protein
MRFWRTIECRYGWLWIGFGLMVPAGTGYAMAIRIGFCNLQMQDSTITIFRKFNSP